jgi:hypothetical protein
MRTLKEFFAFMESESESFSFEELEKYVGNTQRAEYLEKTLKLIDTGSSRMVFDLGDAVLKLAMNDKGEVQNETEYKIFHSVPEQVKEVLARVLEPHDPGFIWIVMEKVTPLTTPEAFEKHLGLPLELAEELFSNFCYTAKNVEDLRTKIQQNIDYFVEIDNRRKTSFRSSKWVTNFHPDTRIAKYQKALEFTSDFAKLCLAVPHLESNAGDLGRLGQLGLNKSGHLVVLDYGFGHTAFQMYNPTPYQQHDAQQRIDMDMDYHEWDEYQSYQYDKYGNKIKQPTVRTNTKPSPFIQKQPESDDIPF